MGLREKVQKSPKLKHFLLRLMIPANDHRPRLWIRMFLNPFVHKKGRGAIIRSRTRMDVFPFNVFVLSDYSIVEDFSIINNAVGRVVVGRKSIIGLGSVIIGPAKIGDNVMLAQHTVISALNHGFEDVTQSPSEQKISIKEIVIENDVWIGANSTILPGVHIGKHAIVGAGSVVTKDVPPFSVAVGNPARVIKQYNASTGKWEKTS